MSPTIFSLLPLTPLQQDYYSDSSSAPLAAASVILVNVGREMVEAERFAWPFVPFQRCLGCLYWASLGLRRHLPGAETGVTASDGATTDRW